MANSDKEKYPALRIIAAWYKAFGYLVGAVLVVSAIVTIWNDGSTAVAGGMFVGAVTFVILSIAVAEIIQVFLDSESNTRLSAEYLGELVSMQAKENKLKAPPAKAPAPIKPRPEPAKKASSAQAETIKDLIKSLRGDGLSPDEIAKELKAEAMPTLDGSASWDADAVQGVLSKG
ncbi:hypothetical protein [Marinobacter subterrani]|uniref:Uncharacterized protein n=1 Tax=Marinobacter subterrani TaxID=1658765 RepID=A0A0J7M2R9_9GAMM|nr:hypothetical protein [Marinobacter subterrani]KMQ75310.1 hypothetical protein Msub_11512 [Marinobacter subterrani]